MFKGTTPRFRTIVEDLRDGDLGAFELAANNIWDYWDLTATIIELYAAYRKVEMPWTYFKALDYAKRGHPDLDKVSARGFTWDNLHFVNWIYREINKAMIDRYIISMNK